MNWYVWKFGRLAYGRDKLDSQYAYGYRWRRLFGYFFWRDAWHYGESRHD